MQELSIEQIEEVNGGVRWALSSLAWDCIKSVGEWVADNSSDYKSSTPSRGDMAAGV
ncbi:hypothetical protein ABT364_18650 [Massilia sp. SR12]